MSRKYYNAALKSKIIVLHPGEWALSDDFPIATSLGSCISVVLYSKKDKLGGMNHFMIATPGKNFIDNSYGSGKYGIHAMELLLNAMYKKNIEKNSIKAAVFGGGQMFSPERYRAEPTLIGTTNAKFAISFLKAENIPIIAAETGGRGGKRVTFFPSTGKIQVKKIETVLLVNQEETEYAKKLKKEELNYRSSVKIFSTTDSNDR